MRLYNSLTRKIEKFKPLKEGEVGLYTCGPTVYDTPSIGNFRTYVLSDLLVRVLKYVGYEVDYVMNLTDVGHLTGDNEGDADTGEDRMEKGARREGISAWEIAERYGREFVEHMKKLNMLIPEHLAKVTEHMEEQIGLVKGLEEKGFVYRISDGIYFDTEAYEKAGYDYGKLSTLDEVKEGVRVQVNKEKKNARDFALWKFSPKDKKRQMEWDSPWGVGFPGWHIECSAISMKYLGEQFDLHVGGEDLRSTHHPNEIAQSEGVTGKHPFVKYWVHGAFLKVDGGRMGKSLGNAYTINDLEEKGIDPLSLRYFYLTGHYRKQLNFTWEALEGAEKALERLRRLYLEFVKDESERGSESDKAKSLRGEFEERLRDDLDFPGALAVVWKMVKAEIEENEKVRLLEEFDEVLGLGLKQFKIQEEKVKIPLQVKELVHKRQDLRREEKWEEADEIRKEIEKMGYKLEDRDEGVEVFKTN